MFKSILIGAVGIVAFLMTLLAGLPVLIGLLNAMVAVSASVVLLRANVLQIGHGVSGERHILGMPVRLFVLYVLIFLSAIGYIMYGNLFPEYRASTYIGALSAFTGILAGLVDWNMFSQKSTFHETEEHIRKGLERAGGWSKSGIERGIERCRKEGMLRPVPEEKKD